MHRFTIPLAFFIALLAALAGAQVPFPQTLPPFTVVGRMAPTSGPSEAIPFDVLVPNLFSQGFCTTANATLVYSAANGWGCQVPLAVASGGTNCTAGSGTCLDNITGFASTGILKRTGAGTYSFLADPLPVVNGGTGLSSTTANQILYSNATSVIAGLATANRGVLGTDASGVPSITSTPTLGTNGGTGGQITFNGATSGSSVVKVAAAAGTSTFQYPVGNGTTGQLLQTDGSGNTSWTSPSGSAKQADQQTFTSSGTWTKPGGFGAKAYTLVQCWGAGGGASRSATASSQRGGGGGAYKEGWFAFSALGGTETVTIGAGGTASTVDGTGGVAGTDSTFGSWLTAYGGSGGFTITGDTAGGGMYSRGGNSSGGYRGTQTAAAAAVRDAILWEGGMGNTATAAGNSVWGGGGGGGQASTAGGTSQFGGNGATAGAGTPAAGSQPGGGGAGSTTVSTTGSAGGAGKCIVTAIDGG